MKFFIFISVMILAQMSLAEIDRKGNGGDICEDRIKIIRDDIASWIKKGGSAGLRLPQKVSLSDYNLKMLGQIEKAGISCTDAVILVSGVEKTCKNSAESGTSKIVCNEKRFLETDDSDQYVLVHHEYAGLAGLEMNVGAESQYSISNQITGYLQDQVVKKLVVASTSNVQSAGTRAISYDDAVGVLKSCIAEGPNSLLRQAYGKLISRPKRGATFQGIANDFDDAIGLVTVGKETYQLRIEQEGPIYQNGLDVQFNSDGSLFSDSNKNPDIRLISTSALPSASYQKYGRLETFDS